MQVYENKDYLEDVRKVAQYDFPWNKLQDKDLLISGGTGLIGSFFVDTIAYRNRNYGLNCRVHILGRSGERFYERFTYCSDGGRINFIKHDIVNPLSAGDIGKCDYVIHLASNTHPVAYATEPIQTITTNVIGLLNILEYSCTCGAQRVVFASSNEIYGENRGDSELFAEDYCGYIDSNTLRAGYPESKRCCEALCQAYIKQKNMDIVIPRFTRTYGPTMLMSDTKAISQFIKKAVSNEDIVLKSRGTQYYSYTYVSDAVLGLLTVMLLGGSGEAYNIADEKSDIMLKDLAAIIARTAGRKVVFELPDEVESTGYSRATKARLDGGKLKKLGWSAQYDITQGITRTIKILNDVNASM